MQVIITVAEQQASRDFGRRIGRLLRDLPGASEISKELMSSSFEPIDFEAVAKATDPTQFKMHADEDGNIVIWINPEATAAAMDLAAEQYGVVVEIGVALYPILRLAKRLMTELSEKATEFGKRFVRKPNALLNKTVPVKTGGWEGVPVSWRQGRVVAACGDTVVVKVSTGTVMVAKRDGELFYSDSSVFESLEQLIEMEVICKDPSWEFAE